MMRQMKWLTATCALAVLAACNPQTDAPDVTTPDVVEVAEPAQIATFKALFDTPAQMEGSAEADFGPLLEALPAYVYLDWDTKSYSEASGATEFTGLSLGMGDPEAPIGVRFDKALVWGFDGDLLAARLQGERLDEAGQLFARLEGTNGAYFGVVTGVNSLIEGLFETFEDDMPDDFEFGLDEFENTFGRVVLNDVALEPWELVKAPDSLVAEIDEDERGLALDAIHLGQKLIAISRSISYGSGAMEDVKGHLKMRQPGAEVDAEYSWDLYGFSDVRGFDLGKLVAQNSQTRQVSAYVPSADTEDMLNLIGMPMGVTLAQEETVGLMVVEDIRLDKAMGFLARSELPGMEERDLISLGRWELQDYAAKLNDGEVLSADKLAITADQFEWIIPTSIGYDFDAVTVEVAEITDMFKVFFDAGLRSSAEGDEEAAAEMAMLAEGIDKAIDMLPDYGLDSITFDMNAEGNWNAESGLADFAWALSANGFGDSEVDFAIDLPVYTDLQTAFEADDRDAAFEAAFEDRFAFRGLRLKLVDTGGYDKILGFAHAIGKEYPDQGWGAMLGNMEPPQMRAYLATMIRMAKPEAERELPAAAEWIESYASYIETGGTFEAISQPPKPINKALIDSYDDEPEPEEFVEIFGISVTHTK